jgi:signal transduction histidine kinase
VADLSIHEFVHPEERERITALYAARMRDEAAPGRYELRLLSRNGDTIWSDIQVRKIDWDGEAAVMATFMDITDLKQAAEELRRAKESSEAANEAKTRFLARMSHELRTPLTSVIGFAQLILRGIYGEPSPPVRDAVEEIDASGQHLLAIINDLLDISRIEAGRMVLRLEAHSPAECLQRVTRQLHALAEEKGLRLELEGEAPPLWRFDPQRITQVLLNLVGNAIKFTRQGTIRVGARTEGGELLYWVADTGIGISGNELERMFQEFQQADSSLTREEQGTGLGLAIAKGIVENHGGKIWAESRVDVGSTFWFTLPPREGSG